MLYAGVLFFLMLQYLRPQEFIPLIRGWRIVLVTMYVLLPPWLLTLHSKKLLRTPTDLFLFFFWIVCAISYWNYWPGRIIHPDGPAFSFGRVAICYLFVTHIIDTRRRLVGAVWTVMLMLLLIAMMGGTIRTGPTAGQYASIGLFDNRNDFAYAIALMLPLAMAFVLRGGPLAKIVGAGVILTGLYEVGATGSRGGQVACLFAVYAVIYMLAKTKIAKSIMLVGGLVALLFVFSYSARLSSIGDYQADASAMGRVEIWADCLTRFKAHWFIGHGYATWDDLPGTPRDTHNSYMRAIVELGVSGLFLYIGMLYFTLRDAHNLTRNATHPTTRVIALGMTGLLVGQIVASLFQTRTYHLVVIVPFAIVSAMKLIADKERGESLARAGPAAPAGAGAGPRNLWAESIGFGWATPRLVTRKDIIIVGALTFGCWLLHKLFVMRSFG